MVLNLTFSSNDPLNNVFVDSANGAAVYQTNSHSTVRRVTNLSRFAPNLGVFQGIAEIHWENLSFHPASILYRGQTILVAEFLRKQGHFFFSFGKVFVAADGRQYKWKVNSSLKLRLYDDANNLVAESHNKHLGIIRESRDSSLDILPSGFPILDDIVLSFILMNHMERERRSRENTAVILNS